MDTEAPASHGRISVDDSAHSALHDIAGTGGRATVAGLEGERTGVFTSLVKEDSDIAGLVAYSIYKQNKLDWLQAFETAKGRVPNEAEVAAYIIGESTPRRLATYRHLAEATLAGKGPDVDGAAPARSPYPRARTGAGGKPGSGERGGPTPGLVVTYAVIAILVVAVIWLATHYVGGSHP